MIVDIVFDIVLVVLLLAIATWSIVARDTFSAIIVFMVYGLLLSLAWVRLAAVDVALTETAIGSGVTGMLLLNAAAHLRSTEGPFTSTALPLRIAAGIFSALVAIGLAAVVMFPTGAPVSLAPVAMAHLGDSGLGNPVAGVLFVYRSFDTLLEKAVLLLALIGVWSLAPDRLWGGIPGLRVFTQQNSILVFLAQTLPPIGILVGIYMFWVGAMEPGGAFQGGTVLAAMWILVMIAGLRDVPPISSQTMRLTMVTGPVVFLAIGIAGLFFAGSFLAYPAGFAKPLIVVIEATLTLSIGVTLGLLAAGPPARMPQS
jgi:multisubunit Na+/H+ antiporter MnhB subunit